jgi:hypothetical protein
MVYGLFLVISEVYLQIWYRYLTIGIRALSLAKEGKIFFSLFAEFFLGKKKRAAHFMFIYESLRADFGQKKIGYLNSYGKNTQFQKKHQPKQSSGSKVMSILNSTVFSGFFSEKTTIFCCNLLFYFLGFFIERYILQGNVMDLVLKHSLNKESQYGKRIGPIG